MTFTLHSRLAADTLLLGDLSLSRLLLMNDKRFPWFILVPRRDDIREIIDLTQSERVTLIEEIAGVSEALKAMTKCDKLNVGALGNMVPQLHIHVIARFAGDAAWPGPVWGSGTAEAYPARDAEQLIDDLRRRLPMHHD
jgi:diadenosine tetraphosphate (Ap4A) HIT family hydrolase